LGSDICHIDDEISLETLSHSTHDNIGNIPNVVKNSMEIVYDEQTKRRRKHRPKIFFDHKLKGEDF